MCTVVSRQCFREVKMVQWWCVFVMCTVVIRQCFREFRMVSDVFMWCVLLSSGNASESSGWFSDVVFMWCVLLSSGNVSERSRGFSDDVFIWCVLCVKGFSDNVFIKMWCVLLWADGALYIYIKGVWWWHVYLWCVLFGAGTVSERSRGSGNVFM